MSLVFTADIKDEKFEVREEHCLCAQWADGWSTTATPEALKKEANPECPLCQGTGIEKVQHSDAPFMNWCNENALVLFSCMGLKFQPEGNMKLPDAMRAYIKGMSRWESYSRPANIQKKLRKNGNLVELNAIRCLDPGMSNEQILERLENFGRFLVNCRERGATFITWA